MTGEFVKGGLGVLKLHISPVIVKNPVKACEPIAVNQIQKRAVLLLKKS